MNSRQKKNEGWLERHEQKKVSRLILDLGNRDAQPVMLSIYPTIRKVMKSETFLVSSISVSTH